MKDYQKEISQNEINLSTKNFVFFVLSLIYYFFVIQIIISYLIAPAIFKLNTNKMSDPYQSSSNVIYEVSMNQKGMGIIKSSHYDSLKDQYFDVFSGTNYTYIVETLIIDNGVFKVSERNNDSFYLIVNIKINCDVCFLENNTFNIDNFNYFINNQNNVDISFYYSKLFYYNDNFENNKVFVPVSIRSSYFSSIINFINYILLFIPFMIFYYSYLKIDYNKFIIQENKAGYISISVLYVLLVSTGLGLFRTVLLKIFNYPLISSNNQMAIESILQSSSASLMILSAVVLGPFVEEFIFRKTIFTLSKNKKVAIIISSFLFGLVHVTSEPTFGLMVINIIPYIGAGVFFGYLYLKNNENTLTLYLIHAFYNLISILLVYI